jgi:hypothetical protein
MSGRSSLQESKLPHVHTPHSTVVCDGPTVIRYCDLTEAVRLARSLLATVTDIH